MIKEKLVALVAAADELEAAARAAGLASLADVAKGVRVQFGPALGNPALDASLGVAQQPEPQPEGVPANAEQPGTDTSAVNVDPPANPNPFDLTGSASAEQPPGA
jgi:hypothetical protein